MNTNQTNEGEEVQVEVQVERHGNREVLTRRCETGVGRSTETGSRRRHKKV